MPDFGALPSTPERQVRALVLVVFVTLLFLLPSVANYHGDESLYTDASIRMVQTGDYWTPYFGDGRLRFRKPILAYWAIVASYKTLGISLLTSRLPFLIAGSLILFLTWRLSLILFRRPAEAALAALIMASNVQLLTVSSRSTPDVLVSLFLLLSLLGFAGILFRGDRSWTNCALAYVGAGLAVQTKGLVGIASVAFAFGFCLLFQRRQGKLRALLEWKSMTLGLAIALSWYVVAVTLHGREVVRSLLADQVSEKVTINPLISLKNIAVYFGGALRHFMPWTLLLAAGVALDPRGVVKALRAQRKETLFLAGWFVFLVAVFSLGNMNRTRYLFPSYPLLAVLSAGTLMRCMENVRFAALLRAAVKVLALATLLIGLLLAAGGGLMHAPALLAGACLALVSAWAYVGIRRHGLPHCCPALALVFLATYATVELGLRPIFCRSPAAAIAAELLAAGDRAHVAQSLNVSAAYQAQVRVFSRGEIQVVPMDVPAGGKVADMPRPVILSEADRPRLSDGCVLKPAGFASGQWRAGDLLQLLRTKTREAAYARNRVPYYVAFPSGFGRAERPDEPRESGPTPQR